MYHLIFSSHSNPNKIFPKEFLIRIFGKREFLQAMCFEHLCLICASVITVYAHIDIGTYFFIDIKLFAIDFTIRERSEKRISTDIVL